jgi:hypothetical protein
MIKSFRYINTVHSRLHEFVLAFFRVIETDSKGFCNDLFDPAFLDIVNHHPRILKKRFKEIYEYVCVLPTPARIQFCQRIVESNQIERICRGEYRPEAFISKPMGIEKVLKELFVDLYDQVLDGTHFRSNIHSTLQEHFDQFSNANEDITLCPVCGIGELKKAQDEFRDQYDHYLPKALYPFSSVNFSNLVPYCMECNSLIGKGKKDTIAVSTGKLFYPYDATHKGIALKIEVEKDEPEIDHIVWQLIFITSDNREQEIESWKRIYSIEMRYQGYIKARIRKWYKQYFQFITKGSREQVDIEYRKQCYNDMLDSDELLFLSFLKKPALYGLLNGSNIVQAEIEALNYS